MRALVVAFLLLAAVCLRLPAASDVVVIANPSMSVDEIGAQELRAIFLGAKTSLNTVYVHPVLNKSGSALAEFSSHRLGKSVSALQTYYRSLVFTGKWSMPPSFASDSETAAYVARTSGAIGFVAPTGLTPGVKVLRVR